MKSYVSKEYFHVLNKIYRFSPFELEFRTENVFEKNSVRTKMFSPMGSVFSRNKTFKRIIKK